MGQPPSAALRVCDFFEVAKNRCCKQSGYDDQIVENLTKFTNSQGRLFAVQWNEARLLFLARGSVAATFSIKVWPSEIGCRARDSAAARSRAPRREIQTGALAYVGPRGFAVGLR